MDVMRLVSGIVLPDIDVDVDVVNGVSANIFADTMTTLRCATPAPVETFSCGTACSR